MSTTLYIYRCVCVVVNPKQLVFIYNIFQYDFDALILALFRIYIWMILWKWLLVFYWDLQILFDMN